MTNKPIELTNDAKATIARINDNFYQMHKKAFRSSLIFGIVALIAMFGAIVFTNFIGLITLTGFLAGFFLRQSFRSYQEMNKVYQS